MARQWDSDDTFGSDIHGIGQAHGDFRGKVKTAQIGFIRTEAKVRGKSNVSVKGRSKTSKPSRPKAQRP